MRMLAGLVLLIPLTIFIGVFSVENRAPLSLKLWPLPGTFEMSASVWTLGLLAIGLLTGLMIGWLAGGRWRRQARSAQRQLHRLQNQTGHNRKRPASNTGTATRPGRTLPLSENRSGQI